MKNLKANDIYFDQASFKIKKKCFIFHQLIFLIMHKMKFIFSFHSRSSVTFKCELKSFRSQPIIVWYERYKQSISPCCYVSRVLTTSLENSKSPRQRLDFLYLVDEQVWIYLNKMFHFYFIIFYTWCIFIGATDNITQHA